MDIYCLKKSENKEVQIFPDVKGLDGHLGATPDSSSAK